MTKPNFEWDVGKDTDNLAKHGVPFALAQYAFADPRRVIAETQSIAARSRGTFVSGGSAKAS